jgi:hypothetical protein
MESSQAPHQYRTDERGRLYGQAKTLAVPSLEDFIRIHADGIAAMDLFFVPTVSFRLLYGSLIMEHGRRQILWFWQHGQIRTISATQIVRRKQAKGIAQCDAINQALSVCRHMANAARVVRLLIASF